MQPPVQLGFDATVAPSSRQSMRSPLRLTQVAIASLFSLGLGFGGFDNPVTAAKPPSQNQTVQPERALQPNNQIAAVKGLPATVAQEVLQDAVEDWGLPANAGRIIKAEQVNWAYGCERSRFPHPCDPILIKGWQVTVENGPQHWIYQANQNGSMVQLHSREIQRPNAKLPTEVKNTVVKLAAQHLSLPNSQVLIKQVEKQTWTDGCLGLPSPVERCMGTPTEGWRVTVEGKPGQVQIYRTDNNGSRIRTEAIAGLPARTDELPTAIAKLVLKDASARLKTPMTQLYILQAERKLWSNYCLDLPTPGVNCPQARIPGWRVLVDGAGQSLVYRVDDTGSQVKRERTAR